MSDQQIKEHFEKQVYSAPSEEAGLQALEELGEKWNCKYPMIYQSWQAH